MFGSHGLSSVLVSGSLMIGMIGMVGGVFAQTQPESANVGHTRHHHPHNHKHTTDDDRSRFFTDRQSSVELAIPSEEEMYSFVVFGDRTGGPADGVSILADAVRDVNLIEPDLVMTVGDLINGYSESPTWLREAEEFSAVMNNLLCPWFPVAGNHDVYWRDEGMGETKPEGELEGFYEMHFGPLWYSFAHKDAHFIVLYSDEGNPETGEKTFHKPESQSMSDEQKAFLQKALDRASDAEHVFVFIHHPRWFKRNYGDDWDNVHKMLVEAGNVSAVFAGHVHVMSATGPVDGIEYFTLATVGGHQGGSVPQAGHLHHYNLITVREGQVAMSTIPVGEIMDPRDITSDLAMESKAMSTHEPEFNTEIVIDQDGSVKTEMVVTVTNPTQYPMDYTLSPGSDDPRWSFSPSHAHGHVLAGGSEEVRMVVRRQGGSLEGGQTEGLDRYFDHPMMYTDYEMLTETFRYSVPTVESGMPIRVSLEAPRTSEDLAMRSGARRHGRGIAKILSDELVVPDGPLTIECWFNASRFDKRVGLIAKTEGSDYGIFVSKGKPDFSVYLGNEYLTVEDNSKTLETDRWYHIAGVFDGRESRLYVDGKLWAKGARTKGSLVRRTNDHSFMIGADVNGRGHPTSRFTGLIDEVRISTVARYHGDGFVPDRRFESDDQTAALYHMDTKIGPMFFDHSGNNAHAWIEDGVELVPVSSNP